MQWLHEHGLIANYEDYLGLPFTVLDDARLYMTIESEHLRAQHEKQRAASERAQKGMKRGIGR